MSWINIILIIATAPIWLWVIRTILTGVIIVLALIAGIANALMYLMLRSLGLK